jgi:hypothetical protein
MEAIGSKIFWWEFSGIFFIIIAGTLIHFVFDWANKSRLAGLFSPVNESVWEHLKLGYWSLALFTLIEYWFIKNDVKSFFSAKACGILALELFIIFVYYFHTAILGKHLLWINIGSFFAGAVLCQIICYKMMLISFGKFFEISGFILFIGIGILMIFFTFLPPHLPIFMDKKTGRFGI